MCLTGAEDFAERIAAKYQSGPSGKYYGGTLAYYRAKKTGPVFHRKTLNQYFTKELTSRLQQYEQNYYKRVTNRDDRRFLRTMEQIYNQPGEKRQLVHMLRRFGIVSRDQKEWQETKRNLTRYEEELARLKRRLEYQEEVQRRKVSETSLVSMKRITRAVMEQLRAELRMERLMYGLDD